LAQFGPTFQVSSFGMSRKKGIKESSRMKKKPPQHIFKLILKQIKETIGTIVRNLPQNPPSAADLRMLGDLGLNDLPNESNY